MEFTSFLLHFNLDKKDKKGDAAVPNYKARIPWEFHYGLRDWQPCLCHFLPQAHKDAHLTKEEAVDFSILYINYSFNLNLPSSIKTKVVKLNIEVNN